MNPTASPLPRWSDDRLDGLERQVNGIAPVVTDVAVMKSELHALTRELRANTKATQEVANQMERAQVEPLNRIRRFWGQLAIALAAAGAAGGFTILGVLLSHG